MLSVDYRKLVSRADLKFDRPVSRREAGLPVGNGIMGSLVWTSDNELKFQINRVDVFANDSYTDSFECNKDYCCGCGFVNVDFGGDVFAAGNIHQHLSVYDGLVTVQGKGVKTKVLAFHRPEVMVLQVEDRREQPAETAINLRMLRPPVVKTRHHTATTKLDTRDDRIILTQEFSEHDYVCRSVVSIGVSGREAKAEIVDDTTVRLTLESGPGTYTIFITSAAAFNRSDDIVGRALKGLEQSVELGFESLFESNKKWWHDFWKKSFVHLSSQDKTVQAIEHNYTYFFYTLGASSRGKYPPKFNGMLWNNGGDTRMWGIQYWWWNTQTFYRAPLAANHLELMQPMFDMYSGMYDAQALAARQQWGSQGIFLPETTAFNGHERLPDDIADELREFMLGRKSYSQTSRAFKDFALPRHAYSSRWNWMHTETSAFNKPTEVPYCYVVHIFSSGAKIAYLYWLVYEYTRDESWLRERAYPMLKGVAEFYRHYPNLKKETDGKYHIHNVNAHESVWGGQDTMEELAAMRGIMTLAKRAAEILQLDADLRPKWQEIVTNLTPLPTSDHPQSLNPHKHPRGLRTWVHSLGPCYKNLGNDTDIRPMVHYDLWTLETPDDAMTQLAHTTFESAPCVQGFHEGKSCPILSEYPIGGAMLGRAHDMKAILSVQTNPAQTVENRMTLSEGPETQNTEPLGIAAYALQLSLCQSIAAGPGLEPVIRVFPAWPKEWDAAFTLLARRGFLVTSSMKQGNIEFVEIHSQLGGPCFLRNPWDDIELALYRQGTRFKEMLTGSLLKFDTKPGERIVIVPKDKNPADFHRTISP